QVVSNPVTGAAYLLIDMPQPPPPPMTLPFTPKRAYVPSMPTIMATVEDRLPELLQRANTTLLTLEKIIARMPESLDHPDRFLSNVDKTIRDSNLPAMTSDMRKFFSMSS